MPLGYRRLSRIPTSGGISAVEENIARPTALYSHRQSNSITAMRGNRVIYEYGPMGEVVLGGRTVRPLFNMHGVRAILLVLDAGSH